MKKIVIASTDRNAGKTNVIIGLARASGLGVAYVKPLGDRLLYKKKRQWDYDAATVTGLCNIEESPEQMSIGFEHAKLRYMYDEQGLKAKLNELVGSVGGSRDVLFIEGTKSLIAGMSVNLDPISMCKHVDAKLVVVASGNDDDIVDGVTFAKSYVEHAKVEFAGVIVNKVRDKTDFEDTHLASIEETGVKVLGVLPYREEFTHYSVGLLSDRLFAKVLAGENGLQRVAKHIVVGAMSADTVMRAPVFKAEAKLVITSGDRSDMILAALETNAAVVVLTNNIMPPANIIAMAAEKGIPMLLVNGDTFAVAKQIDDMDPLTTRDDEARAVLMTQLVKENVKIDAIL